MATDLVPLAPSDFKDKLCLAIKYKSSRQLEVSFQQGEAQALLIALVLDEADAEVEKRKKARRRLLYKLGNWCKEGGITSLNENLPPEIYKYTVGEEARLFELVIERLSARYGITGSIKSSDNKRKMSSVSSSIISPSSPADVQPTQHRPDATYLVRVDLPRLLIDSLDHDTKRITASVAKRCRVDREEPNARGQVVLHVSSTVMADAGGPEQAKAVLATVVQEAFGHFAVRLRAHYLHRGNHQRLLASLPLVLLDCSDLEGVRSALQEGLDAIANELLRPPPPKLKAARPHIVQVPSAILHEIQAFVGASLSLRAAHPCCSSAVTEGITHLTIRGGAALTGAGASFIARFPALKSLQLDDALALQEVGRFLRAGWRSAELHTLDLRMWEVGNSATTLADVTEELQKADLTRLTTLRVAMTDKDYEKGFIASKQLASLLSRLPNLLHLRISAPGRVGLHHEAVNSLAEALEKGTHMLETLALDVDCRGNMTLDRLLAACPLLKTLQIGWKFALYGLAMTPEWKDKGAAICRKGLLSVATALPQLRRLQSLKLSGDTGLNVSALPLLETLRQDDAPRLRTLELSKLVWDAEAGRRLLRSGSLRVLESLHLITCGLHWRTVVDLTSTSSSSSSVWLPKLQYLDVSYNELLAPGEDITAVLPPSLIILPPTLACIRAKSFPRQSEEVVTAIQNAFPTVLDV